MDIEKIEQKIDRVAAGAIAVSDNVGGVMFTSMAEVLEFAKLMSVSQKAVPSHLRANPGACLAITIQALEWRMSPFAVANKSYEVNDRIAYESQLIHAVIEARAPLKERLRCKYEGENGDRLCIVTGHLKGEVDPVEYRSPPISKIKVKNSPLWTADPDQQLWYYSTRAWARKYCPDVLLGIYSEDELRDGGIGPDNAKDITPAAGLKNRLKGGKGRGFARDNVDRALGHKPGEAAPEATATASPEPVPVAKAEPQPIEQQMQLSAGDIETELEGKRRAIDATDNENDLRTIASNVTDFLKQNNRTDLLGGFLAYVKAKEQSMSKKTVPA